MEKQIFKEGDRVFYYTKGWGTVNIVYDKESSPERLCVSVKFDNKLIGTIHFNYRQSALLSFTEYTLQGNSQERPVDWKNYMGKWGKFYDNDKNPLKCGFLISKLAFYEKGGKYPFRTPLREGYTVFEPLTDEQIKILGLEQ